MSPFGSIEHHLLRCSVRWGRVVALVVVSCIVVGCGGSKSDETALYSSDPTKKIEAIITSGREKDRTAVPHLIELLGDDDPVVRMVTIEALERITGERKGYVPYATPLEREAAIKDWIAAYENGRLE